MQMGFAEWNLQDISVYSNMVMEFEEWKMKTGVGLGKKKEIWLYGERGWMFLMSRMAYSVWKMQNSLSKWN